MIYLTVTVNFFFPLLFTHQQQISVTQVFVFFLSGYILMGLLPTARNIHWLCLYGRSAFYFLILAT